MLLLQPPFTKPCEPSAALGQLSAHLKGHGVPCATYDLNIECVHDILEHTPTPADTWSKRAFRGLEKNLSFLTTPFPTNNYDQYIRAVSDINRVLEIAGKTHGVQLSLANYQDPNLSPLRTSDLLSSAEHFRDNIFFPYFSQRITELLEKHAPKHIGLSLNYLSQALCTFAIIGFIKHSFPELKIVIGGGLITTWLKSPHWHAPFGQLIDHFVTGRGEDKLLHIVSGQQTTAYFTADYQSVIHNRYLSPGFILPYAASSGCFWKKCSFCPETSENNPYTCQSAERVLDDLDKLIPATKPQLLHFLDNALSPQLMSQLAQSPPNVRWYGFARICHQLADKDFVLALKASGCSMLKLGIESGSDSVLEQMNKGIDSDLISKVLKTLHWAGINTYIYLLFGTPAEDYHQAQKTLDFIVKHHEAVTFFNLSVFNMPISSKETNTLQTGTFYEGDLSMYTDFIHPKGWDRKKVRQFLDQEFKRHPAILPITKRTPPFFTSNHAAFFI